MEITELTGLDELRAKCINCSHEFIAYELPDFIYGDKLVRSSDGQTCAVLHCLDNPVFDEVAAFVEQVAGKQQNRHRLARLIDNVLGVCCDTVNGATVSATQGPVCPQCGSSDVDEFDFSPTRNVRLDIPVVVHTDWLARPKSERERLVAVALQTSE